MDLTVVLEGGTPWGFRLQGGREFNEPIRIAKINPNSKAYVQGIQVGDYVHSINGRSTHNLPHNDALQLVKQASGRLELQLKRGDQSSHTQIPEIRVNGPVNGDINHNIQKLHGGVSKPIFSTSALDNYSLPQNQKDELSWSSDDSQGSIVEAVDPYRPPGGSSSHINATTTVWSPKGSVKKLSYKPVSFSRTDKTITSHSPTYSQVTSPPPTCPDSPTMTSRSIMSFSSDGMKKDQASPPRQIKAVSGRTSPTRSPLGRLRFRPVTVKQEPQEIVQVKMPAEPPHRSYSPNLLSPASARAAGHKSRPPPSPLSRGRQFHPPGVSPPSRTRGLALFQKQQEKHADPYSYTTSYTDDESSMEIAKATTNITISPPQTPTSYTPTSPITVRSMAKPPSPSPATPPPVQHVAFKSTARFSPCSPPPQRPTGKPKSSVDIYQISGRTTPVYQSTPSAVFDVSQRPGTPINFVGPAQTFSASSQPVTPAAARPPISPTLSGKPGFLSGRPGTPSARPGTPSGRPGTPSGRPGTPSGRPGTPSGGSGMALFQRQQQKHADVDSASVGPGPGSAPTTPVSAPVPASPTSQTFMSLRVNGHQHDLTMNGSAHHAQQSSSSSISTSVTSPPPSSSSASPFSATSPRPGMWSSSQPRESLVNSNDHSSDMSSIRPVWSPGGSPVVKREYKPVKLDTLSNLIRPSPADQQKVDQSDAASITAATATSSATPTVTTVTTSQAASVTSTITPAVTSSTWNGSISHFSETKSGLPSTQSPMVTLLQKSRDEEGESVQIPSGIRTMYVEEGQIPKGAQYVGTKETIEGDMKHLDTFYLLPSEKKETETKVIEKKAPKYHGAGPVDQSGVPVGLRTSVDSQKEWYKKMYKSLHETSKPKEEKNTYKPTYVFPESEPEPEKEEAQDRRSTASLDRYALDRNSASIGPPKSPTRDRIGSWSPPHARYKNEVYRNQPRSIVDYEPGYSSIAFKEGRVTPKVEIESKVRKSPPRKTPKVEIVSKVRKSPPRKDEAESESQLYNPPIEKPGQYSKYTVKDYLSEPDIRKNKRPQSPLNEDPRSAYKQIQKGGEIPTSGLRLPYPEKRVFNNHQEQIELTPEQHQLKTATLPLAAKLNGYKQRSKSLSAADRINFKPPTKSTSTSSISSPATTTDNSQHGERAYTKKAEAEAAEHRLHHSASELPRSPTNTLDRRKREEDAQRRREQMERIYAEERKKRFVEEQAQNEARRHSDYFTAAQKSPIPSVEQRFEEAMDAASLQRPKKKPPTKVRGKARGLYNFAAQNPRELQFRKGDSIYLLRKIDQNWYEGEHHGRVGIFPSNYVEVITSIEDAQEAAFMREGTSRAKFNFNAQTSVELPLRKGETVFLIRRVDENWYEGRLSNGKQGIFPVAYVEVNKEPETPLMTPLPSYTTTPMTGSPGPLSPISMISNGPTIPDAPMSPRGFDQFDVSQQFGYSSRPHSSMSQPYRPDSVASQPSSMRNGYLSLSRNPYDRAEVTRYGDPKSTSSSGGYGYGSLGPGNYGPRGVGDSYGRQADTQRYGRSPRDDEPRYPSYRAVYTYIPQNEDELELREGDIVHVMEKCDDGWYVGTSERTREFGTFPGNYVTSL